jgi:phosphoglycerate dehydrogenase-like enzyme
MSAGPAIVVPGRLPDEARALLAHLGPIVDGLADDAATLMSRLGEARALVARAPTCVDAALLDAAPELLVIGRTGVGVDNIDLDAATRRGIPVVITPGSNERAVAEGAIALLLALVKRLPLLDRLVREGRFAERDAHAPGDLAGSTLAVVGLGRSGRRTAALAEALGMSVLAVDPAREPAELAAAGATPAQLDEALAKADHVALHVSLSDSTRGLVTASRLREAGCLGLTLVNLSRGAVAPLDQLELALEEGTLGAVGLDVFDPEPPDPAHPLFRRDEVICTPHSLALTPATQAATFVSMAEGVAAVLAGGRAEHVANPEIYERN